LKQTKLHKTLNILIRFAIVALSIGFIYWKVFAKGDVKGLVNSIKSYGDDPGFLKGLILVFILMIANWSIETLKWQKLINKVERVPFLKALQSVLSGITVSIFTPNRTGEFIGRAFTLKNHEPVKAVLLTIIGSLSQLLITILAGTITLAFCYNQYLPQGTVIPVFANYGVISGIILFDLLIIAGFLNVPVFGLSVKRWFQKRPGHLKDYFLVIASLKRQELLWVIFLSAIRYAIFSFQFFLMLHLFGIGIPLKYAICIIPLIYLALAVIPTFALSELGVRSSVSLYFIGTFIYASRGIPLSQNESLAIVLAAGLLWLINLAIPAIMGVPFVFRLRFFRK
jgi:hypothetical protein